jgi:Hemolysin coregulated protein Hcp (TssD)
MSFLATLNLDGKKYNILAFDYKASQKTDPHGRPSSKPHGFLITLTVESDRDSSLSDWMVDSLMAKDGYIRFYNRDGMSKFKDVKFETTYCVGYKEVFEANGKLPMRQMLTLSSGRVIYGNTIFEETWARPRKAIEPPKPYAPEKITKEIKYVNGHFYNTNGTFEGKVDETKNTGSVNDVYSCTGKGKKTDENGDEIDVYNGIKLLREPNNTNISNDDLNKFANTVAKESSGNTTESFAIASCIKNITVSRNQSILSTLSHGIFGFTDGGNDPEYKDNAENSMRAVINALSEGHDYSNGASKWDGIDFIAWGLNAPDGQPHNKFIEYSHIEIEQSIFNTYKNAVIGVHGNSVRYGATSYDLPAPVFEDIANWKMPSASLPWCGFQYATGATLGHNTTLDATASHGETIFWKILN